MLILGNGFLWPDTKWGANGSWLPETSQCHILPDGYESIHWSFSKYPVTMYLITVLYYIDVFLVKKLYQAEAPCELCLSVLHYADSRAIEDWTLRYEKFQDYMNGRFRWIDHVKQVENIFINIMDTCMSAVIWCIWLMSVTYLIGLLPVIIHCIIWKCNWSHITNTGSGCNPSYQSGSLCFALIPGMLMRCMCSCT